MARRRTRRGEEPSEKETEKARSASFLPLYIIGGVLVAALVGTMVFKEHTRTGDVTLGGRCHQTSDCRDERDRCHVEGGIGHCVRTCAKNEHHCPFGTKCQSVARRTGRRKTRMWKLCLPE